MSLLFRALYAKCLYYFVFVCKVSVLFSALHAKCPGQQGQTTGSPGCQGGHDRTISRQVGPPYLCGSKGSCVHALTRKPSPSRGPSVGTRLQVCPSDPPARAQIPVRGLGSLIFGENAKKLVVLHIKKRFFVKS